MPEYLSPGVYVEEVNSGPRPIEGVGTAMAAFVGFAPAGPINRPVLITDWGQYIKSFGSGNGDRKNPHMDGSYLSHAVYGYFLNGGGRCYVTRMGNGAGKTIAASLPLPSKTSKAVSSFAVQAKDTDRTESIELEVAPPSGDSPGEGTFTLRVKMGQTQETYDNVSMGKSRGVRNVVETVNQTSTLIVVLEGQATGALAERVPEMGTYTLQASQPSAFPVAVKTSTFKGDLAERSGIEGLEVTEDATMLCCPDLMAAYEAGLIDREGVKAVQTSMIAHCEKLGDRMAILDPLPGLSPQEVKVWREKETNYDSKYAALYYPWINVADPQNGRTIAIPPCGHIAGIYARNDQERGVHKAPANEVVRGALGSVIQVTKGEQDTLNPSPTNVNCIRAFTGRGVRVWGARTLSSDPAWRYVNVRRLFNFVEKSIERGTQWVVFEPNDPDLWARVRRDVGAFLTGVWRSGALFGLTREEAFFVKCDAETNPPDARDRGELVIEVGLAPVKPAEFVIFRLSQFTGGGA